MKEPTEFAYFKGWLLFFVVVFAGGALVQIVLNSFISAFLGAGGMPLPKIGHVLWIIDLVITIPISYLTFRAVVGKYLFPKCEDDEPQRPNQSLEPTADRRM